MKKYPKEFKKEVLHVFATEGINIANQRYGIPKNTIYRWKGQAEMFDFLDGVKDDATAERSDRPGDQQPAREPETAPESPAAAVPDEQPGGAPEAPGEPVSGPPAASENSMPIVQDQGLDQHTFEEAVIAARGLLLRFTANAPDMIQQLQRENERLRRENNQLRRAMQIMTELPEI